METMYFVLGMLSIVAVAFVAVVVWGLLKIRKQETIIRDMMLRMDEMPRQLHDEAREINQNFSRRVEDIWITFRDIRNEMVELSKSDVDLSKSYTDSRIDKLIDTYFDMVSAKKQIIK